MSASTPMEATNGFHRHLNGAAAVPVQVDNNNGISALGITNGAENGVHRGHFGPGAVGIVAMEAYFPSTYVDQAELERYDAERTGRPDCVGKYTRGLGQTKMGFCSDAEDINSIALTVVQRLVQKTGISYSQIGRLEVGTETLVDKSKSTKSTLMRLFADSGNTDVLGVDNKNACYGGTAALFNCVDWAAADYDGDGRYAVAVCADIAVYAEGSARPTGGAGAVAMLIGRDPALVIERGTRCTHVEDVYDFYKPDMSSEYPTVDGKLSVASYLKALDICYQGYKAKSLRRNPKSSAVVDLSHFDAVLFHSPFCKLVQKSMARLTLNDFAGTPKEHRLERFPGVDPRFLDVCLESTYGDREVERAFVEASRKDFEEKTNPSLMLATNVGNMYTASLYGGLVSYVASVSSASALSGRRAGCFSYGSGLVASFFSVAFSADASPGSPLHRLWQGQADVKQRLADRVKVPPPEYERLMSDRERAQHQAPRRPEAALDAGPLAPGTFYLAEVDEMHRRTYKQIPAATEL